ncbi:hypothetical protein [Fodinibius sediminis]|uniref:Predicted metalloprotease, contains C-terminal PDZ domain n=1 Tax=Fodinibius sediminis TaxID=1214077 RepID=A0A521DB56_9BACT|nr:hypothetical protein [Fodinibius sediminis]SMO68311.1 Predicted metalloprotease, contains C-terminal PDZ domain [Fodinibius sediminis]
MIVKDYIPYFLTLLVIVTAGTARAQSESYHYHINLNEVVDDQLRVDLETPEIEEQSIKFYMPNIIPGTYRESNYGMFVSRLKAYNEAGGELPVNRLGKNEWEIQQAREMQRLSYWVEDTYDTEKEHKVYGMSGTNIRAGENYVIYSSGFFGYLEGLKEESFEINFTKPEGFYGSTGLIPVHTTATGETYRTRDYDMLIDSPFMFNRPDTTIIDVANAEVLVSVYSPTGKVTSKFLAEQYRPLLQAHKEYLGGKLPVDKYAFIMYFEEPSKIQSVTGAHEHSYSSFYYVHEMPQEQIAPLLTDIASHEFYHIVTPLNIHSGEIAYFDYNEADLSRHLWLYEGVTEYASHHIQVVNGLISNEEFVKRLEDKINRSKQRYDDELPFTELSEFAAGKYNEQYTNVYQKGALIGAMLDLKIIESTGGVMNLQDVIDKLSQRYGKDQPFEDADLFDEITSMTSPEVGRFFEKYVAGPYPLPLEGLLGKAGIAMVHVRGEMAPSFEVEALGYDASENRMKVVSTDKLNAFGRALGLRENDLLIKMQGVDVDPMKGKALMDSLSTTIAEGDTVSWTVERLQEDGTTRQQMLLRAPMTMVKQKDRYELSLMDNVTREQSVLREQWLNPNAPTADPVDVGSINGIIRAMYDVISGPAGERDWERFRSLFKPGASMGALHSDKKGTLQYTAMTPEEYQERNHPFFMENGFWEEELARDVFRFGEIATVQTAYEFRIADDGETNETASQRGVNSIQLVYDQGRWWITSITWNTERDDNPIPEDLLSQKIPEGGTQ